MRIKALEVLASMLHVLKSLKTQKRLGPLRKYLNCTESHSREQLNYITCDQLSSFGRPASQSEVETPAPYLIFFPLQTFSIVKQWLSWQVDSIRYLSYLNIIYNKHLIRQLIFFKIIYLNSKIKYLIDIHIRTRLFKTNDIVS